MSSLTIVCTDKGTHPERVLGWLGIARFTFAVDGKRVTFSQRTTRAEIRAANERSRATADGEVEPDEPDQSPYLQPAVCPTCRRNRPWRPETAVAILDQAKTLGMSRLDISHLK